MANYYYKGSLIVTPFTILSNEPFFDMTTVSLKTQRASQDHQRWELNFVTVDTPDTEVDTLLGAITGLDSSETMIMPQLPSVDKARTTSGDMTITAITSSGATSVPIGNNNGNLLPKGSFIKFSNHDKIYITTADRLSNGVVNIYPALRQSLTTSHTCKTGSDVILTYFRSIDNATGITFTDGVLSNVGSITLVEAI